MRRLILPLLFVVATALAATGQEKQVDPKMMEKVQKALPQKAPAKPKATRNILVFSKTAGFRHSSINIGVRTITLMGDQTGAYTVYATEDESFLEPEKLKKFDAVFMLNTTNDCFRPKGGTKEEADKREELLKKSLADFVSSGKGLIGIHSATDTYKQWKEYNMMMGGAFVSHPWHQKVPVKVTDTMSPINAAFELTVRSCFGWLSGMVFVGSLSG